MESRYLRLRTSIIYFLSAFYITAICIKLSNAKTFNNDECIPVCDSKECVYMANAILRHMNPEVDPCDNFNSFLCGGFEQRFAVDDFVHMVTDVVWKKMLLDLKDIITNIDSEPGSASSKMKIVYDSCIKHGSSDSKGVQILIETLNSIGITNWPKLSPDFQFTDINISELIGTTYYYTSDGFFKMIYDAKYDEKGEPGKEKFFNVRFDFRKPIQRKEAVDILKYFDLELEDIEIIFKDYEDVQMAISNLYKNISCEDCSDLRVDCRYQRNDDLFDLCQTVNWLLQYVNWNVVGANRDVALSGEDTLYSKTFFNFLKSLPHRKIANFFAMKLFYDNYEHLNFFLRRIKSVYAPSRVDADEDMQCVKWITEFMNMALQNEFIRRLIESFEVEKIIAFYKDHQRKVSDMVVDQDWILSDFKINVQNMIKEQPFAIEFLKNFFPNDTFVNEHYKTFQPTKDFFANILQLKKFRKTEPFLEGKHSGFFPCSEIYDSGTCKILNYLVKAIWFWDGSSIGWKAPFSIAIGFGVIGSPLAYLPGQVKEINYVNLGGIVGHEFGHSLDKYIMDEIFYKKEARSSSENGTIINCEKRRKCIVNSLSEMKYDYLNENLDGDYYLGESLADSVGITLIDKFLNDSTEEFQLPGLSISTDQLLYMSANQVFCGKYNKKQELRHKHSNNHPPTTKRLLFMTRNSRKFSEIFQCPLGSYMNPSTKCTFLD